MRFCTGDKILKVFIILACLLCGCKAPEKVRLEASQKLETYKPVFERKIKEAYGDKAGLTNVECPTLMSVGSPVPDVTYKASEKLTANLQLDGKSYVAEYYPEYDIVTDTVHTENICKEITDSLPIDRAKILDIKYTDASFLYPKFPSEADTLEKAFSYFKEGTPAIGGGIVVNIITSEDLSKYSEDDFTSSKACQTIKNGSLYCNIKIVSLKDEEKLSTLVGRIHELHFESRPRMYVEGTYKDVFEYCHIKNAVTIGFDKNEHTVKYTFTE